MTRAVLIAFVCTFFSILNIPVFWPILLIYFIVLFTVTMKKQIMVNRDFVVRKSYYPPLHPSFLFPSLLPLSSLYLAHGKVQVSSLHSWQKTLSIERRHEHFDAVVLVAMATLATPTHAMDGKCFCLNELLFTIMITVLKLRLLVST